MTSSIGGQTEDYLRHLVVERGLSDNTVQSYRRDLLRYQEYLRSRGIGSLAEVTRVDVEEFRRHLDQIGLAPASVTRCVVEYEICTVLQRGLVRSRPMSLLGFLQAPVPVGSRRP